MNIIKEGVSYSFTDLTDVQRTREFILNTFASWEPHTFNVFKHFANPQKVAIDIGAWIGLTPIWLCKNFKHVICVDADVKSTLSLRNNLKSSECENYSIVNSAIYSTSNSEVIFGSNKFIPCQLNESMSQIKTEVTNDTDYKISTISMYDLLEQTEANNIGIIKVDIEGGEENILEDLFAINLKYNAPLLISFHISWWNDTNISRFQTLFDSRKIYDTSLNQIQNPIQYLQSDHFASIVVF